MRVLIEAHHPGDIHFWKYPIQEMQNRGHTIKMVGRDRDVMKQLIQSHPWIDATIPNRKKTGNKLPLVEFMNRQIAVSNSIRHFKPHVVTSLFGSYSQTAWAFKKPNIIFTDSEFQHFNHRIAHPFASEVHTPTHFYKNLGPKQRHYKGIHELAFLDGKRFHPKATVLEKYGLNRRQYIVLRLSAWNTLHDINQTGIGSLVEEFVYRFREKYQIVISAEENCFPQSLKEFSTQFAPEEFHDILAFSRFVLTEGASTASEAACLGIPTVYINSTEPRGYLQMLEQDYGIVQNFHTADNGIPSAIEWLDEIDDESLDELSRQKDRMIGDHIDVTGYVVHTLERFAQ